MSIKLYGTGAIFSFLIIYSPHSFSAERFTELEQVNPLHNLREPALDVFNECVLNGRISRVPSTLPSLPEATTNTNTSMNTSKEEVIKTDTTKEVAAKEIDEKREQLTKVYNGGGFTIAEYTKKNNEMVKEYPVIENRNTTTTATVTVTSSPSKALEVNLINLTNEVILHHWNEKNHDLSLALDLNAKNKDDNVAFTISNFKVTANPESPAYGDYDKSLKEFKITNIISGGKAKATSGKAKATESPTHDTSDKKSFILPYVQPGQISCNVCFQTMGITVEFTLKNSWRFYTQKINHLIFDDGKILKPEAIIIQ